MRATFWLKLKKDVSGINSRTDSLQKAENLCEAQKTINEEESKKKVSKLEGRNSKLTKKLIENKRKIKLLTETN